MTVQLGWLDTNLFVHALFPGDRQHARCREIIRALEEGAAEGWVDLLIVHELTYVLGRLRVFPNRAAIQHYIRTILLNPNIQAADKAALLEVVARWATEGVGFADAWLTMLAQRHGLAVCSANVADFPGVDNTFASADL